MTFYRIKNWKSNFEVAQNGACKTMSWIAVPVKHDGKSYRRLMALPNGPAIYAAWILIAAVASKCSPRGSLIDDGEPLSAEDLHFKTGAPESLFGEAFQALASDRIGWLESVEGELDPAPTQATLERTQGFLETPDKTGQDRTRQLPVPVSGVLKSGKQPATAKTVFKNLTSKDLSDDEALESWYLFATSDAQSPVLAPSEANLLNVFAAAERAIEHGSKPIALFASIVGKKHWELITNDQEERARRRIANLRRAHAS